MTVSEQLAAQIRARLAALVAADDPDPSGQRGIAVHLEALPLYADMGGCIAIRPDGELLLVHSDQDWAPPNEWTREIEPQWRIIALVVGSRKYPELRALLPTKGVNDVECGDCSARTYEPPGLAICGTCLGMGWRSLR